MPFFAWEDTERNKIQIKKKVYIVISRNLVIPEALNSLH